MAVARRLQPRLTMAAVARTLEYLECCNQCCDLEPLSSLSCAGRSRLGHGTLGQILGFSTSRHEPGGLVFGFASLSCLGHSMGGAVSSIMIAGLTGFGILAQSRHSRVQSHVWLHAFHDVLAGIAIVFRGSLGIQ